MDLLERYLAEVRRNLPARDADDIVAELRDVLTARAEDQEEATGNVDWEGLLRDFGHPLVVAARYRKHQWLIGPEMYPFYLHFLKIITGIVLAVVTGIAIVKGMLWDHDVGQAIVAYLGSLWWSAASAVGSVTIVFALIERFGGCFGQGLPEVEAARASRDREQAAEHLRIGLRSRRWRAVPAVVVRNRADAAMGHDSFRIVAAPDLAAAFLAGCGAADRAADLQPDPLAQAALDGGALDARRNQRSQRACDRDLRLSCRAVADGGVDRRQPVRGRGDFRRRSTSPSGSAWSSPSSSSPSTWPPSCGA